jgi:hypothetical protein
VEKLLNDPDWQLPTEIPTAGFRYSGGILLGRYLDSFLMFFHVLLAGTQHHESLETSRLLRATEAFFMRY